MPAHAPALEADPSTPASRLYARRATRAERRRAGAELRAEVPLDAHRDLAGTDGRFDPLALLAADDVDRLQDLVPIRWGRMAATPFTFLRGSAGVMAADLARGPSTTVHAQLTGDSHLSNFGFFASPDRRLVFDLNDFDETIAGPFEWDVKRLAASVAVAAAQGGADAKPARKLARRAVTAYRTTMHQLAEASALDVWYYRLEADRLLERTTDPKARKRASKRMRKFSQNDSTRALRKLTTLVDGRRMIVDRPPLVQRLDEVDDAILMSVVAEAYEQYRATLPDARASLLDHFQVVDVAIRVGGVGSVGTRCLILLLQDGDGVPLFLQVKEAVDSCLAPYVPATPYDHPGQRVVEGQRLLQAASDEFLGWSDVARARDGGVGASSFYWRQLKDMKGSVDVDRLTAKGLERYATICGTTLARGHARSGDASMIAGYLGETDEFDRAVARFAHRYRVRTEADHARVRAAIDSGAIAAVEGV